MSDKPRSYKWAEFTDEIQRLENQAKAIESVLNNELETLKLKPKMKTLDAGCGTGSVTRTMAKIIEPGIAYGIDFNSLYIDAAKKLAENEGIKNIKFELQNVDDLKFDNDFFDLSYCRLVLMHVQNPVKSIEEMIRVTKKGGIVSASDTDDGGLMAFPQCQKFFELWHKFGQWRKEEGENRYVGMELYSIFNSAGLSSIKIYPSTNYATQETPSLLEGYVSIYRNGLRNCKKLMIENDWATENDFEEM